MKYPVADDHDDETYQRVDEYTRGADHGDTWMHQTSPPAPMRMTCYDKSTDAGRQSAESALGVLRGAISLTNCRSHDLAGRLCRSRCDRLQLASLILFETIQIKFEFILSFVLCALLLHPTTSPIPARVLPASGFLSLPRARRASSDAMA